MKKITKAYRFLYYQLFKHYEKGPFIWMSEWKAALSLDILEIWLILSLLVYYTTFFDPYFEMVDIKWAAVIYFIFIAIPNHLIFIHKNQWETIVKEFDHMPPKRRRIWSIVAWCVIFLVIANLILAFYFMSRVDWEKYR